MLHAISDWNSAYANTANIAGGDRWPDAWVEPARAFREQLSASRRALLGLRYGEGERHAYDLFMPEGTPQGLVVFVHGGYWLASDHSFWSHFAAGPLAHGYAVAMPSYLLCPQVRLAEITQEIGKAVEAAAARIGGPLRLIGHSAGGHLATRMITRTSPLPADVRDRIAHVVSLSGLHDLRPLMKTDMNATLGIDDDEALRESPALLQPMAGARLTTWVGGAERAEFRRQSALLSNIWLGLGAQTCHVEEPDRHHFSVLDGLADAHHPLTQTLMA